MTILEKITEMIQGPKDAIPSSEDINFAVLHYGDKTNALLRSWTALNRKALKGKKIHLEGGYSYCETFMDFLIWHERYLSRLQPMMDPRSYRGLTCYMGIHNGLNSEIVNRANLAGEAITEALPTPWNQWDNRWNQWGRW